MTRRREIDWLDAAKSAKAIKAKITTSTHKSFPVCRGRLDNVVGMVHSKDMLNAIMNNKPMDIEALMRPPLFLHENATAYHALERFIETKQGIALVVDEARKVRCVLTMNDLVDALVGE